MELNNTTPQRTTPDEARAFLEAFAHSCEQHGLLLERVKFSRDEDGHLEKVTMNYTEIEIKQPTVE